MLFMLTKHNKFQVAKILYHISKIFFKETIKPITINVYVKIHGLHTNIFYFLR